MTNMKLRVVVLVALLGLFTAQIMRSQVPPARHLIVREVEPGVVLVDRSSRWALDELANRTNTIVLYWNFFSPEKLVPRTGTMEVPGGPEGNREFAAAAGYALRELSPRVIRAEPSSEVSDGPILVTAQLVRGMGSSPAPNIPAKDLEWELLRSASDSIRNNVHASIFGSAWIATYYWPTREGHGHEFYVQQQSSTGLTVNYPPQRYLRKVSVESVGGALELTDLWLDRYGKEPQARFITGPVAELELDFDGDGVVDVVCFSGVSGEQFGGSPLIVLSGKTGDEIGRLNGYEFVIAEDVAGRKRISTLGRDGYRIYALDSEGELVLERSAPLDDEAARPLLEQAQAGKATVSTLGLNAADRVIADFVLPHRPANLISHALQRLKVLTPIGERMSLPPGGVKQLQGARVLLDYRPKPMEPAVPAPREHRRLDERRHPRSR
jgi:hypothetical protein